MTAVVPWAGAGETSVAASGVESPRQGLPEPVVASLQTALEAYEEVRASLAADRLDEVPASASRLTAALHGAREEAAGLSEGIAGAIDETAIAAESMAEAEDLAAARIAFGEVSRGMLLLAGRDRRLPDGWHAFVCPMAEEFGRWIQPEETLENPYMGPAMLTCGSSIDWSDAVSAAETTSADAASAAAPSEAAPSEAATAEPEPIFEPGIPGLGMIDVRDYKFLWREIDELQTWERGDRITVAEYRAKVIEKTAHFLELDGTATDDFTVTAAAAVASVRHSFDSGGQGRRFDYYGEGWSGGEHPFSADLKEAAARVTSVLGEAPRHRLFAPEARKWLLKLAFGPGEVKEAREAEARSEPSVAQRGGDDLGAPQPNR